MREEVKKTIGKLSTYEQESFSKRDDLSLYSNLYNNTIL